MYKKNTRGLIARLRGGKGGHPCRRKRGKNEVEQNNASRARFRSRSRSGEGIGVVGRVSVEQTGVSQKVTYVPPTPSSSHASKKGRPRGSLRLCPQSREHDLLPAFACTRFGRFLHLHGDVLPRSRTDGLAQPFGRSQESSTSARGHPRPGQPERQPPGLDRATLAVAANETARLGGASHVRFFPALARVPGWFDTMTCTLKNRV